jgi:hypothetical protein
MFKNYVQREKGIKEKSVLGMGQKKYSAGENSRYFNGIGASAIIKGSAASSDTYLSNEMCKLLHASLASSTWSRYGSGLRSFLEFENYIKKTFTWPLSAEVLRSYVTYCISVKNLKPSSVKTYLSALVHEHKLRGFPLFTTNDAVVTSLLRGAEHLAMTRPAKKVNTRRVMSLQLLRQLGHRLGESGWHADTVQVIWTAFTVAFFTSARMGELLSPSELWYDDTSTLTWDCVKFRDDNSFLLHVRMPKSAAKEGEFLDVFEFSRFGLCPVAALKRLRLLKIESGCYLSSDPVFRFKTGKNLTPAGLNNIIRILLANDLDWERDSISCHSFRAAVASALTRFPSLASSEDVKGWGRWSSEAYNRYTRLKTDQKRTIFHKIMSVFE